MENLCITLWRNYPLSPASAIRPHFSAIYPPFIHKFLHNLSFLACCRFGTILISFGYTGVVRLLSLYEDLRRFPPFFGPLLLRRSCIPKILGEVESERQPMKFTPGFAIGAASGSVGGTTFSRNRYGAYTRTRAVPVTSQTQYAINARAAFSNVSQLWRGLTDAQRLSWQAWASGNPIIDNLGQSQVLSGNAAFLQLNARLYAHGLSTITAPPVAAAPTPLTALSATYDIGAGTTEITFAATPVPANTQYEVWAAVVSSPGINYVRNLLKHCGDIAAAAVTGFDYQSIVEARFGALAVGLKVVLQVRSFSETTGLVSDFLRTEGVVVTT